MFHSNFMNIKIENRGNIYSCFQAEECAAKHFKFYKKKTRFLSRTQLQFIFLFLLWINQLQIILKWHAHCINGWMVYDHSSEMSVQEQIKKKKKNKKNYNKNTDSF